MTPDEQPQPAGRRLDSLTPRELEVLRMLARGYDGRSIARDLGISRNTVWRHRAAAIEKLEADGLMSALAAAGWLTVPA